MMRASAREPSRATRTSSSTASPLTRRSPGLSGAVAMLMGNSVHTGTARAVHPADAGAVYAAVVDLDAYVAEHARGMAAAGQLLPAAGAADRRRGRRAGRALPAGRHPPVGGAQPLARPGTGGPAVPAGAAARARSPARRRSPGAAVGHFFTVGFPLAVYRAWPWWLGGGDRVQPARVVLIGYVAAHPEVAAAFMARRHDRPGSIQSDFAGYYSQFAAAELRPCACGPTTRWLAALCLAGGVLIVPVVLVLWYERVQRRHDRRRDGRQRPRPTSSSA